jgi:uncharacterized protein (DUF2141 family)
MKLQDYFYVALFAFATIQCAKQTTPTGGPKDEEPPTLVKSTPPNQTVNFKERQIELTFNEPIQLNNPREQLIITPSIGTFGKDFELTARKTKVILTLKSELEKNTTYSINFRESIADLNEKNSLPLKYAISTGDYIDSLYIKGSVYDILSSQKIKNFTVAIAPHVDTFDIFKHTPLYFTYTDKESNYLLENLKAGKYILYGFDDKNKNLKVDSRSERYGFIGQPIDLEKSLSAIDVQTFKLDASDLKLISGRPSNNIFNIKTNKSITTYSLESTDPNQLLLHKQDKDPSNIIVFNTLINADSVMAKFTGIDSINNKIDTLIYIKFLKKDIAKEKFQALAEPLIYLTETKTLKADIKFTKPILKILYDSVYLRLDSINTILFTESELTLNETRNSLTINKLIPDFHSNIQTNKSKNSITTEKTPSQTKSYGKLTLAKSAFISAELDSLAKTEIDIKTIKPEDVAIVFYKIDSKENFIVQLVNKNQLIIQESKNKNSGSFNNLTPGNYQLKVIVDKNGNGKWDAGDYKKRTEPEKIIFYKNSKGELDINIKANWEVGPLLISIE